MIPMAAVTNSYMLPHGSREAARPLQDDSGHVHDRGHGRHRHPEPAELVDPEPGGVLVLMLWDAPRRRQPRYVPTRRCAARGRGDIRRWRSPSGSRKPRTVSPIRPSGFPRRPILPRSLLSSEVVLPVTAPREPPPPPPGRWPRRSVQSADRRHAVRETNEQPAGPHEQAHFACHRHHQTDESKRVAGRRTDLDLHPARPTVELDRSGPFGNSMSMPGSSRMRNT